MTRIIRDASAHASNRIPLMWKDGPALQSSLSQQWTSHSIVPKAARQVVLVFVIHFSLRRHLLANVSTSPTLVYTLPHRSKAGGHVWVVLAQASHEIVVEQVKQAKPNTRWITKLRNYFENERTRTSLCDTLLKQPPPFLKAMGDSAIPLWGYWGEEVRSCGPRPRLDFPRSLRSSRGESRLISRNSGWWSSPTSYSSVYHFDRKGTPFHIPSFKR